MGKQTRPQLGSRRAQRALRRKTRRARRPGSRGGKEWAGPRQRGEGSLPLSQREGRWRGGPRKEMSQCCVDITAPQRCLPHPTSSHQLLAPGLRAWAARYLIVGAHIQQDGEALLWADPSARRVQGQLAHGDAHAVAAQISQAQDALAVRHHHSLETIRETPLVTQCSFCHSSHVGPDNWELDLLGWGPDNWVPISSAGGWNTGQGKGQGIHSRAGGSPPCPQPWRAGEKPH